MPPRQRVNPGSSGGDDEHRRDKNLPILDPVVDLGKRDGHDIEEDKIHPGNESIESFPTHCQALHHAGARKNVQNWHGTAPSARRSMAKAATSTPHASAKLCGGTANIWLTPRLPYAFLLAGPSCGMFLAEKRRVSTGARPR